MKKQFLSEFAPSHRTASVEENPSVDLDGFLIGPDEENLSNIAILEADDDEIEDLLPLWHLTKV